MGSIVERKARSEVFSLKPYVPGKPVEEVERELGITGVIKLASNENPLGPSPMAVARVQEALKQLNMYPDGACYYLRKALAGHYGFSEDSFLVGNGSDELLRLISETFVGPGDEVLYGMPSFSEYGFMARVMGGTCVEVPLKDMRFDLPAILDKITEKTKLVYICNPNNPTGTITSRAETDQFMKSLPDDVLVIFDEAYYEYVTDKDYVSGVEYLSRGRNVIVLRTFSKIRRRLENRVRNYHARDRSPVNRVREPFNVNLLAQTAAIGALADREHLQKPELNLQGRISVS